MGAIAVLLGVAFLIGLALNLANVVGRYLFSYSIVGADEVQIFIMVWLAFLGAAIVTWRSDHLRMDLFARRLPPRGQRTLALFEALLLVALSLFVVTQSSRYVLQMIAIDRRSDALGIPMAIPHAAVLVGFALIAVVALLRLVQTVRGST